MPKFKRELVPGAYLTAADMLHTLAQQQLVAAALDNTIVIAAEPAVAWLLDRCCIGRPVPDATAVGTSDGSSSIASRTAAVIDTAGFNRASLEVQQQFEQHQAQLLARKQRRVRRTPGYVATGGIAAPAATPGQPAAAADAATGKDVQQDDDDDGTAAVAAASVPIVAAVGGRVAAGVASDGAANGVTAGAASSFWDGQQSGVEELALLQLVQLSCQEAFFLAQILACCSVYAVQQAPEQPRQQEQHPQQQQQQQQGQQLLTPAELWSWCCSNAPGGALGFASRYAAYKHFRCKGWLPLPGLLYGADYVLYKLHPEWAHSDFLVLVMVERPEPTASAAAAAAAGGAGAGQQQQQPLVVDGGSCSGASKLSEQQQQQPGQQELSVLGGGGSSSAAGEGSVGTQLTWLDAHIMQRLARQVLKQLLLLYVMIPHGLQLGSVECMQQVSVREVLLQRWVPSEHREEGKP
jgi:hypothetical protein